MSVSLHWDGLDAFEADLEHMPEGLATDAQPITESAANSAAAEAKANYPFRSGNLRNHVFVSRYDKGKLSNGYIVKNTAKLAWIFEKGTEARHYFTKQRGVIHATGKMPPGRVFVPAMQKWRRKMNVQLKGLLEKYGLVVSGEE